MSKKVNKSPFVRLDDGSLGFELKMAIYPKNLNDLTDLLKHVKTQIDFFRAQHPRSALVTGTTDEIAPLKTLEADLEEAESCVKDGNWEELAYAMYTIGHSVCYMNFAETWNIALNDTVNLAAGRSKGTLATKTKASIRKDSLKSFAIDYFKSCPAATYRDAIVAMQTSSSSKIKSDATKYQPGPLEKIISGCKKIALEELSKN